jgi:hypothetical protein
MNAPNEDPKPVDNMELLKQQASACGPNCDCHGTESSGQLRWVLGATVLVIAATLAARAVVKSRMAPAQPTAPAFPTLASVTPADSQPAAPPAEATTPASSVVVGREIGALAELNTVAESSDAVFVYVTGKDASSTHPPVAAVESAAKRIGSQGTKIGIFTLRAGSRDAEQLAAQMTLPGVLAMVKGKGMSPVSGEITETKLIQGFVAASNCGPGGCGPGGCCPAAK